MSNGFLDTARAILKHDLPDDALTQQNILAITPYGGFGV